MKLVFRTIEIKEIYFEVENERQQEVVETIKQLYPDLSVEVKGSNISVSGDLHNYKRRDNLIYILSGGKHGKNIQDS